MLTRQTTASNNNQGYKHTRRHVLACIANHFYSREVFVKDGPRTAHLCMRLRGRRSGKGVVQACPCITLSAVNDEHTSAIAFWWTCGRRRTLLLQEPKLLLLTVSREASEWTHHRLSFNTAEHGLFPFFVSLTSARAFCKIDARWICLFSLILYSVCGVTRRRLLRKRVTLYVKRIQTIVSIYQCGFTCLFLFFNFCLSPPSPTPRMYCYCADFSKLFGLSRLI